MLNGLLPETLAGLIAGDGVPAVIRSGLLDSPVSRRTLQALMPRALLCVLGVVASAIVACGGSVTETPADLGAQDAAAPDAAFDSGGGRPLGADQCRMDDDCRAVHAFGLCYEPAPFWHGGPCPPVDAPCQSDEGCRAGGGELICDVAPGDCPNGPKSCIAGCMGPADCRVGETCTAHRCVPLSCASDAQCPTDFACGGGICARKACTTDAVCSGYCVRDTCYSVPGSCGDPLF
jgi:hypothetical protein